MVGGMPYRFLAVNAGLPTVCRRMVSPPVARVRTTDFSFVVATPAQVEAMKDEIHGVIARYRRVGQGNPAARRLAVYSVTYPLDLDRVPRGEQS